MSIDSPQESTKLPKLAIAAAIVALLLALSGLVSAFHNPFVVLSALVPALAGITILLERSWGAYGFALFELAEGALLPLASLRNSASFPPAQIAVVIGLGVGLAVLFFLAGRALSTARAKRGPVFPWIAASLLFTLPFFFVHAFSVPTGAMEDTLLVGDRIMVRTFPPMIPTDGDIIVFHYPVDRRQTFIKRVIGFSGDRIRIVSRVVYRNGAALNEPYAVHKFNVADKYRDNLPGKLSDLALPPGSGEVFAARDMLQHHVSNGEVVVPPGKYFVLGDNRDNSLDSRHWGFVDALDIIGKPLFIYDSEEAHTEDIGTETKSRHQNRIRWGRILKVVR